ncbi:MAG: hypothetical protein BRC33_01090 [Cyanobacteria bacterium SW_9_44_58]|nr:MAG: hypothetical protein BRC33_01090 [Cyanobacteria bacterium SW_9_44_58]
MQLITDSVQGGIAYIDRDQCYRFVNQTYQNWLGCSAEEIIGKTVEEMIGKEAYSQKRLEALQKVWQGEAARYEGRRPCRNQQMRDVSIMLVPDWSEQGTVEGFYSLIIDITERKERERRAIEQEQFLRSIYEGVNQAIFVIDFDEDGELRWADYNWISEQLMGVPRTQGRGKTLEQLFSPDLAKVIRKNYEHCLAAGHSISYEECMPYQQQRTCWLLTLTPLRNSQGRIDRVVGTGINIDYRKELENTLREQAERQQLLNTITRSIRQSLDVQEVAQRTVSEIQQAFQATRAILAVADSQQTSWELLQAIPHPETQTAAASLGLSYEVLQHLFQKHEELIIADAATESLSPEIQAFAQNWEARSLLAVPIWGEHSQLKGSICLQVCHEIRYWRDRDMKLLHDVSEQIAIALQQAQLYQQLEAELNQRYQLEDQLRYDAIHDQLTGLPNRIQLRNRLQQKLQNWHGEGEYFAVFFLDLNRFKAVNDTLGHSAGDELLTLVGQRLQHCLRETDLLVRFGGDEFVIILEHLPDRQGALELRSAKQASIVVANRIHDTLSTPFLLLGEEVAIGTSIGIVIVHGQYDHPDSILRNADTAMYQAKTSGAKYIIFS